MLLLLPSELVTFHFVSKKRIQEIVPSQTDAVDSRVLASRLRPLRTIEQSPNMSELVVATDAGSEVNAMGKSVVNGCSRIERLVSIVKVR